jgi:hypothetical protein
MTEQQNLWQFMMQQSDKLLNLYFPAAGGRPGIAAGDMDLAA